MFRVIASAATKALRDRRGVTATEYTLMIVGIAALVIASAQLLGGDISTALSTIGSYLTTATAAL